MILVYVRCGEGNEQNCLMFEVENDYELGFLMHRLMEPGSATIGSEYIVMQPDYDQTYIKGAGVLKSRGEDIRMSGTFIEWPFSLDRKKMLDTETISD